MTMHELPKSLDELTSALAQLATKTADEIAAIVEDGGYLISDKVATEVLSLPELKDGWKLHATTPHKLELPRIIFIAATVPETRVIWERGQANIARNAGLSEVAIQRWLKCNSKHKYRFLKVLAECEVNESAKAAYLAYVDKFDDSQYREWVKTHEVRDGLSPTARMNLVDLIKQVLV